MATLHIEHAVTDLDTWTRAYARFAEVRRGAGVRSERVRRPADDPTFVVIDLDFETTDQAAAFLGFLRTQVWARPEASPALAGRPEARILVPVALEPAPVAAP
ncbi:MAG TPA: hypothetical protein VFO65_02870 [Acidimicrobiales bacterium]|nr:hypothetical protein [Acidimicrobiales bacterium]